MACIFDFRWQGVHGIGRFATEVGRRLPVSSVEISGRPMSPLDPFRLGLSSVPKGQWYMSPGYNAPLFGNVPYVITVHDLNHVDRTDNSGFFKRLYYIYVLKRLLRRARAVLTVSEFSKNRIVEWSGVDVAKVFNVGNGVSDCFRAEGEAYPIVGEYLLCVSNRRGHKNELGLLKAFAQSRLPSGVKLVLTGDPEPVLLELAHQLSISSRLVFSGRLSEDKLAALYRGALFMVFPSFYEGFGLPIIEAFACGTPVITSNVTSMPEIAGDAALLVDPYSTASISEAIIRLYDSPELRAKLIRRGFDRLIYFSWDAVSEKIKEAVQAVDTDPLFQMTWS